MSTHLNKTNNWVELAKEAKWSPKALAAKCHVCMRTLERHFQRSFGLSPHDWMNRERMKIAGQLLIEGVSVKEVAADLGYKHAHGFSRHFHNLKGYPPTRHALLTTNQEKLANVS